ncbi:MAG: hypothetical protein V3R93_06970 [Candidatus Hydrothermarchaeaceae archaeon]
MATRTVRISDKVYRRLFEAAGQLQTRLKRPVSIDETLDIILERTGENRISDLTGSWDVSGEEVEYIKRSLRKGWKKWSI